MDELIMRSPIKIKMLVWGQDGISYGSWFVRLNIKYVHLSFIIDSSQPKDPD